MPIILEINSPDRLSFAFLNRNHCLPGYYIKKITNNNTKGKKRTYKEGKTSYCFIFPCPIEHQDHHFYLKLNTLGKKALI